MSVNIPRHFCIVFLITLTACTSQAIRATPTEVNATAVYLQAVATANAQLTAIAILQPTVTPIPTLPPTATSVPTPTPPVLVTVDGLRMAYIIDGNLYIQDSGGQPVQLTHGGLDRWPKFTDDGEKIVFYRGKASDPKNVYSINADGSQEQALVTSELLVKLNLGYNEFTELGDMAFVPGTHNLLFNTREFKPSGDEQTDINRLDARWNQDMLLANIDTAEIKRLAKPGTITFWLSPDQKLNANYIGNHVDVVDIKGQMLHRNLIISLPEWKGEGINLTWTQDSNTLIILPPINGNADPSDGPEPRTLWKYPIDGSPAVEIRLNPAPMGYSFALSPDGNWIIYANFFPSYHPGKTDETIPEGIYIGNLRDGSSRFLGSAQLYGFSYSYVWSPDSEYFIFRNDLDTGLYLGNTKGDVTPLNGTEFIGWMDNNRYLYKKDGVAMGEVGKEGSASVVDLPTSLKDLHTGYFTYVFVNPK